MTQINPSRHVACSRRWGGGVQREVRERKKKGGWEGERGGKRGGSFALAPYPTPGFFLCWHLFAPSPPSESLEQPRHRSSNLRSAFFFWKDKGITGRGYDLRLSRIRGSTESVESQSWFRPWKNAGAQTDGMRRKRRENACKIKACWQRRGAQRKERRKVRGVAFFPLVLLLLFQTLN